MALVVHEMMTNSAKYGALADSTGQVNVSWRLDANSSLIIDWRESGVSFEVDEVEVFASHVSPKPPLGLVIWIDNQYAAFTPEGKIGFGVLENPEPAWLEIKDIDVG